MNHRLLLFALVVSSCIATIGQTIPFPNSKPPVGTIGPWGHESKGTNWDTSPYEALYYNRNVEQDIWFRLMPPNGVDYDRSINTWTYNEPGKKYPIILFFHGKGERGTDNNNQLKHGGKKHRDAVLSGRFPGFLLYPQGVEPFEMKDLLDKLVADGLPIDLTRVYVHGLSLGAKRSWEFALAYPHLPAAIWPMSGIVATQDYSEILYTPIRLTQGGRDNSPTQAVSEPLAQSIKDQGGQIEYILLPNAGHGTWNQMYNRNDFFEWFLDQSSIKIYAKDEYSEVCPEDPINVTLGINKGYDAYEWRKDGITIPGADGHELNVTSFGDYTVRATINGELTEWSDPLTVSERQPTQTPPIALEMLASYVLPDPNGNTTVNLTLPSGFEEYEWFNDGVSVGNEQIIAANPGEYTALVRERYGCSSLPSAPFNVIENTFVDVPAEPTNIVVSPASKTEMSITWLDNATIETGIELYRRESTDDPYELIALLPANSSSYDDSNLRPGTDYYYSLRAINSNGASNLSAEVFNTTERDEILPTVPENLTVVGVTDISVTLTWDESSDDVGVSRYDIYQDGAKVYTTDQTYFTVYNLTEGNVYRFHVRSVDISGNESVESNRVVVSPVSSGLNYKYYEGSWSVLPDFNSLSPVVLGHSENVDISERLRNDNFGFLWEGKINIPVAGDYTFETNSDDGSKLYIGGYDEANLVVNNDGLHGSRFRSGTYNFPAPGSYPIAITFFERGGGERMEVYWSNTAHGVGSRERIPSSAFADEVVLPEEEVLKPSGLTATVLSTSEIELNWVDESTNEINYQIFRATQEDFTFVPIGLLPANSTSFTDSGLQPETEYFYKVVALGLYSDSDGTTGINSALRIAFDNNIDDISGNGVTSNTSGAISYDQSNKIQGSASISFAGNNNFINLDNSDRLIHDEFTERSVAFWLYNDDNSGIQDVLDEGGATNGFGIRINNGSIELGVQDNNNQSQISAPIATDEWVHIAAVFNNGQAQLYVNGVLEASNADVGYNDISAHSDAAGLGATNGSNAFDQNNNNFDGNIDDFYLFESAISEADVNAIIESVNNQDVVSATTDALPTPTDPLQNLRATPLGQTSVLLEWDPNNVNYYNLLRSVGDVNYFAHRALTKSDVPFYQDNYLQPHTDYYYTVRSITDEGFTENSDTVLVSIPNALPVMDQSIPDYSMRSSDVVALSIAVSDLDGDEVTFELLNNPAFVSLTNPSVNIASISIEPQEEDFGNYEEIVLRLNDGYGGIVTDTFNVEVITNYAPTLDPIAHESMSGGKSLNITITASDADNDHLSWEFFGLPTFASPSTATDGLSTDISFNPNTTTDGGLYQIGVKVTDDNAINPKSDSAGFTLTVIPFDPNHKVYINLGNDYFAGSAPWNNFTFSFPSEGRSLENLINDQGFTTSVSIHLDTRWGGNSGGSYPGIFEENVQRTNIWTDEPETIRLSGMDQNSTYDFEFLASTNKTGNRTSTFEINGQSVSIDASGNKNSLIEITGIAPDTNGDIFITISKPGSSTAAYLNAIIINASSENGVAPLKPTNLTAESANGLIELNWDDNSNNEDSFEVFRSAGDDQNFTLIASPTESSFTDDSFTNEDQYYKVRAVNQFGNSDFSNEVLFVYENRAPIITGTQNLQLTPAQTGDFTISINEPEGEGYDYQLLNAPGFVNSSQLDDEITITANPTIFDLGTYELTFEATDINDNTNSASFTIEVVEVIYDTVLVNTGRNTSLVAAAPWNNFLGVPNAGTTISNLLDTEGNNTGISIEILDTWDGGNTNGMVTGNDSGVYPDDVMENYFADNGNAPHQFKISGLSSNKIYNLTFFGSRANISTDRFSIYSSNGTSVSLNVRNNSSETVSINGLVPDANGEIIFDVTKNGSWKYLNALVINSYEEPLFPPAPSNLEAQALSSSEIELSWNDNSSNEDGFEIFTSSSSSGPWTLLHTAGPNETTYTHTGLTQNQVYYYYVRAYNSNSVSFNSEIIGQATYSYAVYINIGGASILGASPWNNTADNEPFANDVTTDLLNAQGSNTGIAMEIVDTDPFVFGGSGTQGVTDPEDDGVFPNNVMQTYWWFESGSVVSLKFKNLPLNQIFDFEFFASRTDPNRGTTFIIGEESVSLIASGNTSNTVRINDVMPNAFGEVTLDLTTPEGMGNGYINAVVIRASNATVQQLRAEHTQEVVAGIEVVNSIEIYPNPVESLLRIKYNSGSQGPGNFQLYDLTGRMVENLDFEIATGINELGFNLDHIKPGNYIIKLTNSDGIEQAFRILKR
ncbi:MAG: hypothetical protein Tsb0034_13400 [Ekhidna sp.]